MEQVQVIYYLCRGSTMDHPHCVDVSFLSCTGLFLKDVKRRLMAIRGRQMPDSYSWSYKRNYKNDFIWHDVSDDDVILATNDREYIIKGCEIPRSSDEGLRSGSSDSSVQFKKALPQPSEDTSTDVVKIYRRNAERENNDATTQTDSGKALGHQKQERQQRQEQQKYMHGSSWKTEKPLPDKSKESSFFPSPSPVKGLEPTAFSVAAAAPTAAEEGRTARSWSSAIVLKQILPCRKVTVETKNLEKRGPPLKQQEQQHQRPDVFVFASSWNNNAARLSSLSSAQNGGFRKSTSLTRYRPRNSFSNSDYFDSFEHKLKDMDLMSLRSSVDASEFRTRMYDLDKEVISPRTSVGSQAISKLIQATNETDKEKSSWWEGVSTPKQTNEMPRRNKLDWEKNLQKAVDMIIHEPPVNSNRSSMS